jgi:hypothetical protein
MTTFKCYNYFELEHILWDCSKLKTEQTKQIIAIKLATVLTDLKEVYEDLRKEHSWRKSLLQSSIVSKWPR